MYTNIGFMARSFWHMVGCLRQVIHSLVHPGAYWNFEVARCYALSTTIICFSLLRYHGSKLMKFAGMVYDTCITLCMKYGAFL